MNLLILVVDDEPDVEALFRQHFRHDLRAGRFTMEFAYSATAAIDRIENAAEVSLILILSDINMPGMSGLELLPKAKALRPLSFSNKSSFRRKRKRFPIRCTFTTLILASCMPSTEDRNVMCRALPVIPNCNCGSW
jgi:CheY-like chemotaxis protein